MDGSDRCHDVAMADDDTTSTHDDEPGGETTNRWVRRAVLVLVLAVLGLLTYQVSAAFFPRWWAQRIGDQVDGRFVAGTLWGLFYGFVFSVVPLLVLAQARRRFWSWTWRGVVAVVAVLLAAPNWLTLSVVIGSSNAANAGRRIMDVDAPNFRAATVFGVVAGVVVAALVTYAEVTLKRRRGQVRQLRGERDELRARDGGDHS